MTAAIGLSLTSVSAQASDVQFSFNGDGFSGSGSLTIAPNVAPADPDPTCGSPGHNACRTDPPGAYAITAITGTFSNPLNSIVNATITGLVPTNPANEKDPIFDPRVPSSLSFVDYGSGALSYDNLFYPGGSPNVCTTFPFGGTFVDVYGVAFTVAGGYTVDLWGDGDLHGPGTTAYGVSLTDGTQLLATSFDGVNASVAAVPEPSSFAMLSVGLLGMLAWRKRAGGQA
jgi:hypothetical protein